MDQRELVYVAILIKKKKKTPSKSVRRNREEKNGMYEKDNYSPAPF